MIKQILAAVFGTGMPAANVEPPSTLNLAARTLLAKVDAAIAAGDWKIDGANDPDAVIASLGEAIAIGKCDQVIGVYAMELVDCITTAFTDGEWRADGDVLEAAIDVSGLVRGKTRANDEHGTIAQAA